jgi:SAM-dependent methyltransferase
VRETFSGIEKQKSHNANAILMNADHLGFSDHCFDDALCGFMGWDYCYDFLHNEFTGPDLRMREIHRVLRTGGRVGLSSWERQADLDWMQEILIEHFPSINSQRECDTSVQPMVYSWENLTGLEEILTSAGFNNVHFICETAEFVSPDEETWWCQMKHVGWHQYFEEIGTEDISRFKQIVFDALQAYKMDEGIKFSKTVIFAFGEKLSLSQFGDKP